MKTIVMLLLCLLSTAASTSGQNCPSSIWFKSQSQVDSFPILYPNCRSIENVTIWSDTLDPIMDLSGLASLDSVTEYFSIRRNLSLTSLKGLENLLYVRTIRIAGNLELQSISALEGIQIDPVYGSIIIDYNPQLSECNIGSICQYLKDYRIIFIQANGPGCRFRREVVQSCNFPPDNTVGEEYISEGFEYWDRQSDTLFLSEWGMTSTSIFNNNGVLNFERTFGLTEGKYAATVRVVADGLGIPSINILSRVLEELEPGDEIDISMDIRCFGRGECGINVDTYDTTSTTYQGRRYHLLRIRADSTQSTLHFNYPNLLYTGEKNWEKKIDFLTFSAQSPVGASGITHFTIDNLKITKRRLTTSQSELRKEKEFDVQIFPNPTHENITIAIDPSIQINELCIFDAVGCIKYKGVFTPNINMAKWGRGLYLIQLKTNNNTIIKKILVH